jgi:hypothetical protein
MASKSQRLHQMGGWASQSWKNRAGLDCAALVKANCRIRVVLLFFFWHPLDAFISLVLLTVHSLLHSGIGSFMLS